MLEKELPEEQDTPTAKLPVDSNQSLVTITARLVMVIAVGLSLYQLYTAGISPDRPGTAFHPSRRHLESYVPASSSF